jgi:hypothetical protein
MKGIFLSFVLFCCMPVALNAQRPATLHSLEDTLADAARKIQATTNDSVKNLLNLRFKQILQTAIGMNGSFTYPFDSLKKLGKLTSPDKRFRLYNWNLPLSNGINRYFCFIQFPSKTGGANPALIELSDHFDSIPDPEHAALDARNWYGALYYKIIPEKAQSGTIYTLLGWQGVSTSIHQKIIEVMTFDDQGNPRFGMKIFNKYKDGSNQRVIFRFSSVATMILRYEGQYLSKGKKWNASSRAFEEKKSKAAMIVCDRLVPLEQYEGNTAVMIPAADVYDGFLFDHGIWTFVKGVDARNY